MMKLNGLPNTTPSNPYTPKKYSLLVVSKLILDQVYNDKESTQDLFNSSVKGLILTVLEGINTTIFAYGQTSSGKTFTVRGNQSSPGIIPLALQALFNEITKSPHKKFTLQVSFLELYNESINDLLDTTNQNLDLKEDIQGIYIKNLAVRDIGSVEDAMECLYEGDKSKKVGETLLNTQSSRSHTVFRIRITSDDGIDVPKLAQLNIVDLAGSEGLNKTKAEGIRRR